MPRPAADRPNVLFLFPDQHRPDWLPGNPDVPVRMPALEGLMARGVRFANAFTPSPLCAPARACLAAGRRYADCGVPGNDHDYPLDQATYYQRLRSAGYEVAGVGKLDLHKATHDWGLDGSRLLTEWGFTRGVDNEGKLDAIASGAEQPRGPYMAFLHRTGLADLHVADFAERRGRHRSYTNTHPTPLPPEAYCDNWVADNAARILRDLPADRPWHLVVNFTGPHNPMDVTAEMAEKWNGVEFPPPVDGAELDPPTHQQIRRNYAAMLENIDTQVARLIDLVADRGELDRTLIVYSSDHGEMLGDHDRWGKSIYYQPSVGVPLVIAGPTVTGGVTSDALVLLQDLTATFLQTAGADPLPEMDGRSLWPVLRGASTRHRRHVQAALHNWRMVFDGRFKHIRADEQDLLFDHDHDPWESVDLAARRPDEVHRLTQLLDASPWGEG